MDNEMYFLCEILTKERHYFKKVHACGLAFKYLQIPYPTAVRMVDDLVKEGILKRWRSGRYTMIKHFDEKLVSVENIYEIYKPGDKI